MSNFLFYDDIKQYLREEEVSALENGGKFFVSVGAYWTKVANMDYDPSDPNSPKHINTRMLNINFKNVSPDALNEIENAGLGIWKTSPRLGRLHGQNQNGTYNFTYNPKRENDKAWNIMVKAISILQKYYNEPIIDEIKRQIDGIPETGEIENTERLANEKWIKMIQDLGNGETNELIERFIKIFGQVYEWHYGHKLSMDNAKLIISQKPDATLIFTEYDWKRMYNHVPKPGAKKILFWAPNSNKRNLDNAYDKQKQRADAMGIQFDKTYQHSTQSKNAMAIEIAELSGSFRPAYGYDVSDVQPINPEDSEKLENTLGMVNNLTGEMNQHTINFVTDSMGEKNDQWYQGMQNLMKDNASFLYYVLVQNLKENPETAEIGRQYGAKGNSKNNPDFRRLLPNLMGYMVDQWLEDDYKVKKSSDRVTTRNWIVGMVLVFCNVWTASSLSAVRGGKVTYEQAAHYSTIINKLLTLLNDGAQNIVKNIREHLKNMPQNVDGQQQQQQQVNEGILNGNNICTPEKFIQMLGLQVVDDGMSDDEFKQKRKENMKNMYEMLQRMNNTKTPMYR